MPVGNVTEPKSQNLYVMQNEFGCIKVGRSIDPWQRRLKLCQTEHCKVELVAAFDGGGEDEETIHIELDEYRLEGEWFDGAEDARAAIQRIFGLGPAEWKFAHDPEGAAKWLDHLRVVRDARFIRKALTREIVRLRTVTEPSWVYDSGIFWCRYLSETGNRPVLVAEGREGETVNVWYDPQTKKGEVLPAYTASVEAALLAWPDDIRPAEWEGSPIDCCIAALTEIRSRLPTVTRPR